MDGARLTDYGGPLLRRKLKFSAAGDTSEKRRSGSRAGPPEGARPAARSHHQSALCGSLDQSKLRQGRHAIVEADLLDNLAVLELQNGRAGELHLAPRVGGQ
jgi:hypothetical protein